MSNIDQMEAVRSDLVSGCQKPDRSTPAKIKLCCLRPRRADAPFRACLPRQVPFKAERLADSGFVVGFADGSTVEVTEAQLRSEQRFRHRLRLKLGREFAAQSQSSWEYVLAWNGIIDWTERALEYDGHVDERLERARQYADA
jgi:hypothetical protein